MLKFGEYALYRLSKSWPSPVKKRVFELGEDPSSERYHLAYALKMQYDFKVKNGVGYDIRDKSILEIGCGRGGISCFMAMNGALKVTGIDINDQALVTARKLEEMLFSSRKTNVFFIKMSASKLEFDDNSFDLIIADNVFEHFMEPEVVMKECFRTLKPGGLLSVGSMPSYYSRYGLHLKNGLKLPWANLFFSERTICNVMVKLGKDDQDIVKFYPGVRNNPKKVRDLRAYADLNEMTYSRFKRIARDSGFKIKNFSISATPRLLGKIVHKFPGLSNTLLGDIFSIKASGLLEK